MIPTIRTDRLILRPYKRSDWDAYLAYCQSGRTRYMGGPLEPKDAWAWFTNDIATWGLYGFGTLAIEHDGTQVGFAGLVQPPNFPEPELGWGLFEGHDGQGYATEAGRAMLAHAFATTGLNTVVSYVDPDNAASAAVATRIGGIEDPNATGPDNQSNRIFRYIRPATGGIQ